jgi:membrane-bound ClpP family serine protease
MPLFQVLFILIVIGVVLWMINSFVPMASSIKGIFNAVVVLGVLWWLGNVFGIFHSVNIFHAG